jgi:hypothetical protein
MVITVAIATALTAKPVATPTAVPVRSAAVVHSAIEVTQ